MIAEDAELPRDTDIFIIDDPRVIGAHQGAKVLAGVEERKEVVRLAEVPFPFAVQERLEGLQLRLRLSLAQRERLQLGHHSSQQDPGYFAFAADAARAVFVPFALALTAFRRPDPPRFAACIRSMTTMSSPTRE